MRMDVGIGEFKHSSDPGVTLKTYGLGSCVALVIYSSKHHTAGLVHVALPEASVNPVKAANMPGYFADTGIPLILGLVDRLTRGVRNEFTYRIYGGASILDENGRFDIGRRNALMIKRLLWKAGCGIIHEDVGGNVSRTISVSAADGNVAVSYGERRTLGSEAKYAGKP